MTAADPHVLAELLDRLAGVGSTAALEVGGDLIIHARAPAPPVSQREAWSDGTRFTDETGWAEQESTGK